MRRTALIVLIAALAMVGDARADEPWQTMVAVELRAKPGEKGAVVAKLPAGTVVKVQRTEGRWLLVRVGKKVGYLTRTTVTGGPTPAAGGTTGKWSAARRPDPTRSATVDALFIEVVGARSVLRAAPAASAAPVAALPRGAQLTVLDATKGAWIQARDDQGRQGWIARPQVDNGASSVVVTGADLKGASAPPAEVDRFRRHPLGRVSLRAAVGAGYRAMAMSFSSNGQRGSANYLVSAAAATVDLSTEATVRLTARGLIGLDVRARLGQSSPGIDYAGRSGATGKVPFSAIDVDGGVRAGLRLRRLVDVSLRAGLHYDAFIAEEVDNVARLPRERLLGATVGARLDLVPPRRVSVTATFDVLLFGTRQQTAGLEDGEASAAHGLWGGVALHYQLTHHLAVLGAVHFGRTTTDWTGMSVRQPGVTDARRVDSSQLAEVGLSAGF